MYIINLFVISYEYLSMNIYKNIYIYMYTSKVVYTVGHCNHGNVYKRPHSILFMVRCSVVWDVVRCRHRSYRRYLFSVHDLTAQLSNVCVQFLYKYLLFM